MLPKEVLKFPRPTTANDEGTISGPAELLGQGADRSGHRVADGFGAVPGQRRTVLDPRHIAVAVHKGQVQGQRESGGALDERADRGALEAKDEVAFPVAGGRPILSLGRAFADEIEACAGRTRTAIRSRTSPSGLAFIAPRSTSASNEPACSCGHVMP